MLEIKHLYDHFVDYAAVQAEDPFLFDEERCYTVKESLDTCVAIANELYKNGVKEGSLVAFRTTRSIDATLLWFSLQFLGALTALSDPHQGVDELPVPMTPDFTVSNEKAEGGIAANGSWLLNGSVPLSMEKPAVSPEPLFPVHFPLERPTNIIFTSGSTGRSKGVMLSQLNLTYHVAHYSFVGCYEPDDVQMECLPIHHVFGLAVLFVGLIRRYRIYFPPKTDVAFVANAIQKYGITRLDGVPSYALAMARYKNESGLSLSTLRVGVIAGAPMTDAEFCFIEDTLCLTILPVYGMSECIAISGSPKEELREKRAGSVGRPIPGYDLAFPEGEICVRCPVVTCGYYNDPEATAAAIDEEGWLHTGDLGCLDEEGFLHVTGRKKDIIIRNGINLSAVHIEKTIETLPYVSGAAVVGVRDPQVGEVPVALVVLSGEGDLDKDLPGILAKNEIPARILYADAIPMTSSGKTDKVAVKKLFED